MRGNGLATQVRLITVRLVKNQTGNGKIMSFSVMMVAGNERGGVGFAIAKDKNILDAMQKATKLAEKNMEHFDLYDNRTIYHDIQAKFKASKLFVRAMPGDKGRRCHWAIQEVCRCAGIRDLSAKVYGSRHPMNVVQGFFLALRRIKTPKQIAYDTGMRVTDVLRVFNNQAG
jgi:ribosomal protein S5